MAFDYVGLRGKADTLLAKFGQTVSLRRATGSTGNDWAPTQSTTDYATTAAIINYTQQELKDESILATDRRGLVAAGPLTTLGITGLLPSDQLVVGGVAAKIVVAKPISPAGVVVLYDCQLRF